MEAEEEVWEEAEKEDTEEKELHKKRWLVCDERERERDFHFSFVFVHYMETRKFTDLIHLGSAY